MLKRPISCTIDLKIGRNICLKETSVDFEFESPGGHKLRQYVKLKKYLVFAHIFCSSDSKIRMFVLMTTWMSSKFGSPGVIKLDTMSNEKKYVIGIPEATFILQSTKILIRMFILIKYRKSLNVGHLGS